ncbi:hypothetical protein [uncultured Corynebacterium sp.]|nr:hypothetical protein [uncultured Corynebacterium sp.]
MQALLNWQYLSSDAHVAGALLGILKQLAGLAGNLADLLSLVA